MVGTLNPKGTNCFTTNSVEVGTLTFSPAAQGQYQGPRLIPLSRSTILGMLGFSPHAWTSR